MLMQLLPFLRRRRRRRRQDKRPISPPGATAPQSILITAAPGSSAAQEVARGPLPAAAELQKKEKRSSNAINGGNKFPFHLLPSPIRAKIWSYILPPPTFTHLPAELRFSIWEETLPPSKTLKIGMSTFPIYLTDNKFKSTHPGGGGGGKGAETVTDAAERDREPYHSYTHIFSTARAVPVILQVCRESRSIGLSYYEASLQTNALPSEQTIAEFMASRGVVDEDGDARIVGGGGWAAYEFSHGASQDIRQLETPRWIYWSPSRDVLFLHSNFPLDSGRVDVRPSATSSDQNGNNPRQRFSGPRIPGLLVVEFRLQLSHEKRFGSGDGGGDPAAAAPAAAEEEGRRDVFRKVQNLAISAPLWQRTSREQRVRFIRGLDSLRSLTLHVKELPAAWGGIREEAWGVVVEAFSSREDRLQGVTLDLKYARAGFIS